MTYVAQKQVLFGLFFQVHFRLLGWASGSAEQTGCLTNPDTGAVISRCGITLFEESFAESKEMSTLSQLNHYINGGCRQRQRPFN